MKLFVVEHRGKPYCIIPAHSKAEAREKHDRVCQILEEKPGVTFAERIREATPQEAKITGRRRPVWARVRRNKRPDDQRP